MVINISKIKTEALLLFCKDLIEAYQNSDELHFDIDSSMSEYINEISQNFVKQIANVTYPSEYYIQHHKQFRIKAVLHTYNFINQEVSKYLKEGMPFNPAMLYFSMLAVWFKEFNKESKSKEYIYFLLFPYGNVYDKMLLHIEDEVFKKMNIQMIEIAERAMISLDQFSIK